VDVLAGAGKRHATNVRNYVFPYLVGAVAGRAVEGNGVPSFAKEGWLRHKENIAKLP
jgi:hypothetical protein